MSLNIIGEILEDGTIERGQSAQGEVYWNLNAFKNKKGVCYVPELHDTKYTYNDFMAITNAEDVAEELFNCVDWQSPESLFDEWVSEGEIYLCKGCDRAYFSYEIDKCPHCGAPKGE